MLNDLTEDLSVFDRLSTLRRLVYNCEKADAEERHWTLTSAALMGLYGDGPETVQHLVERMSRFSGARASSRVLTEMALCACPLEGGRRLSDLELSKLIARAALVVRIGGLSDAIHYNALVPEVKISRLGDVLFRDEFGSLVAEPMMSRMVGERVLANAPLQRRNYEEPAIVDVGSRSIDPEFSEIWRDEMGFDLDEARRILDALEQKGVADGSVILELTVSQYVGLASAVSVPCAAAANFLRQFCLATRPSWAEAPSGFATRDIEPWRFGRRLSYITRPILRVDGGEDPVLLVAPGALRTGVAYVLEGAFAGRLDRSFFRTPGMRDSWLGRAREGHSFNSMVAQTLSEEGWDVCENIGLPELLNQRMDRDWGDIDVLAWRKGRSEVLAMECKDLAPARNYSEIAALLSDYQGVEVDGRADKLKKHLNRISILEGSLDGVARYSGVSSPRIVSCLVCSGVVPMQYAKIPALAGTRVGTLEEVLRGLDPKTA